MHNQRHSINSPDMLYQSRHQFCSTNMRQGNQNISPRNYPYQRSPICNNSLPSKFNPRCSSPFYNGPRRVNRSFNTSTDSAEQWSMRANSSFSSESSSSSHFGDVSQFSPYNSPHRNRSPYHQNVNNRFQGKQSFHKSKSSDSNPGHSHDIKNYIHQSMLEDPWKELVAEIEKKN